jgi:hypothetical protein
MDGKTDNGNQGTGGERAEACWNELAATCPDRNHDEDDFQAFPHHGLEARGPGEPIELGFVAACLLAQLGRLGGKGRRSVMQRNQSRVAQDRLAQPADFKQQQKDADDEFKACSETRPMRGPSSRTMRPSKASPATAPSPAGRQL